VGLLELLGDDGHGGVRIQEAIADHLPDQFVGTAVIGLGTAGEVLKAEGTLFAEAGAQLEVALFGVVVLAGGGGGTQAVAFAFQEHGEFVGDDVVGGTLREPPSPRRADWSREKVIIAGRRVAEGGG